MASLISYPGILPFGTDDSSVVMQCAMTDSADITAKGGTLRTGATVDATKGVAGATSSGSGAVWFDINGYDSALEKAGQISFETEWANITTTATGDPRNHAGFPHASDAYLFTFNDATFNASYGGLNVQSGALKYSLDYNTESANVHGAGEKLTQANGDFAQVTLSWFGQRTMLFINGVLMRDHVSVAGRGAGGFRYLFFGSTPSGALPVISGLHYRNLIVSTSPVMQQGLPVVRNVVIIGDSIIAQSQSDTLQGNEDPYHSSVAWGFKHTFAQRGIAANVDLSKAVAGALILNSAGTSINSQIAGALALNPSVVCYMGGTNDAIVNKDIVQVEADLKSQLTTILNYWSVDYVVVARTITLNNSTADATPTKQAYVDSLHTIQDGLIAWAAANGFAGRLFVSDQFTAFGGHTPIVDKFGANNTHPSSFGKWDVGKVFADELIGKI